MPCSARKASTFSRRVARGSPRWSRASNRPRRPWSGRWSRSTSHIVERWVNVRLNGVRRTWVMVDVVELVRVVSRRLAARPPRTRRSDLRPGRAESLGRRESGSCAVLVEAPAVVGAGEDDAVGVDLAQPPLRGYRRRAVERVLVLHPVDHGRRIHEVLAAEGDQVVGVGGQPLEPGEVVGDRDLPRCRRRRGGGSSTTPRRCGSRAARWCRCAAAPCWTSRASRRARRAVRVLGSASMASAWWGCVAMTTASYAATTPLPSVTSTPSAVSTTEVILVPTRTSGSAARHAADVLARAAGDRAPRR